MVTQQLAQVFQNSLQFFIDILIPIIVIFWVLVFFFAQYLFIRFYKWVYDFIKKRIPYVYEYLDKYLLLSEIREKLLRK